MASAVHSMTKHPNQARVHSLTAPLSFRFDVGVKPEKVRAFDTQRLVNLFLFADSELQTI